MKVLVTGSTATHCSKKVNNRVSTFTGQFVSELESFGHEVVWQEPSLSMDISYINSFDSVVVGMAPLTSIASRWLYGSLSVYEHAKKLNKAIILIDAPEPYKVWAGVRAIANKPQELIKPFYSNKKEYLLACDPKVQKRLNSAIKNLYLYEWPSIIYPKFPWYSDTNLNSYIPNLASEGSYGLNFDRHLLEIKVDRGTLDVPEKWTVDAPKTKWTKAIEKTLNHPVVPIRDNYWQSTKEALRRLECSVGTLISPYKDSDSWWSVSLSQSLFVGSAVVTDWRSSAQLGQEWSLLASSLEQMSPDERHSLAMLQKKSYLSSLPHLNDQKKVIENAIF
jgi:hypothetical protein